MVVWKEQELKTTLNSCEKGILYLSNNTHFFKKRRIVIQKERRKEIFNVIKTSSENFLLQKGK